MCGIIASISNNVIDVEPAMLANRERGRDSWGFWMPSRSYRAITCMPNANAPINNEPGMAVLGCLRAEPTTEWVREKRAVDVQPYEVGNWVIVHNGTIANDVELREQHRFITPTLIDSWVIAALLNQYNDFARVISMLVGSYAICAVDMRAPDIIYYAMNYHPLYLHQKHTLSSVPLSDYDRMIPPYSIGTLTLRGITIHPLLAQPAASRALVVCSGGLDSTVAAAALKHAGMEVELLHYDYGCRATRQEGVAIHAIAKALDVPLHIVKTPIFTDIIKGSPLTNTASNAGFAEAEAGAEYAHEWVPARNLIMTSIAVGIAESRGFNVLALGANLEESGAYPDNEPEFLKQFARLLPFSVRDGTQLRIATPVGNLMKHEIVKLGLELQAPLQHTWSCYNNSDRHCGTCGPCFMRRTAFEINGAVDPVFAV